MDRESFALVAGSLRARGFKQVRAAAGARAKAFRGELACRGQKVGVRLEISDWDFVSYPSIFVESAPDLLKGFRTHVQSGGSLCYYMSGSTVLNRFKPAEAVARCLRRAEETLEEMAGQKEVQFGIHDEFGLYWMQVPVYVGELEKEAKKAELVFVESRERKLHVLTQTGSEPKWIARAIGGETKWNITTWLIETKNHPAVDVARGLPRTIKDVFEWVKRWDPIASQRMTSLFESKGYLDNAFVGVVFISPVGPFGFLLEIDRQRAKSYQRRPALYRQYLHARGENTSITRFFGVDISSDFVHSRNLVSKSLQGKRVAIIGCGAIGGYVAHSMARLGAGVDEGGRLALIDIDQLQPGNLGRHLLGFPALHLPKAEALAQELRSQFPYLNIVTFTQDVRTVAGLFDNDLIVDATGEESLSIALARPHQERLNSHRAPPILHVWIAGNGEACQALMVDGKKGGCYRCMWTDDSKSGMKERIPLLKEPPKTRFVGCQSVTMFPVSAAMSAAALATDMVLDWLEGNPSPRFRTRARENARVFRATPQDLSRLKDCPACSRT